MGSRREVTVGELLDALGPRDYSLAAGPRGLGRRVLHATVQRIGVALTGHTEHLERDRLQMLGTSETAYLVTRSPEERRALLEHLARVGFPGLVVSAGNEPSPELYELAEQHGFALITTVEPSIEATDRINTALTHSLAPRETRHGVLLDVYGVGVLLIGKSGIGKSEVALELVAAGHRLVSDDVVLLTRHTRQVVVGSAPDLTRHHMEIRGLGIINVKDLFGAAAVRERKRVELVCELVEWDPHAEYDRLGLDARHIELAGVPVKHVTLPVRPGRSLTTIIQVAARDRLLQMQGTHSARAFADRLDTRLRLRPRVAGLEEADHE